MPDARGLNYVFFFNNQNEQLGNIAWSKTLNHALISLSLPLHAKTYYEMVQSDLTSSSFLTTSSAGAAYLPPVANQKQGQREKKHWRNQSAATKAGVPELLWWGPWRNERLTLLQLPCAVRNFRVNVHPGLRWYERVEACCNLTPAASCHSAGAER